MDMARTEDSINIRKGMSRVAITLALEGRWSEACQANRQILDLCPTDVDTLNRLGKALLELGQYPEAQDAFEHAITISPYNSITQKNLERLSYLHHATPVLQSAKPVSSYPFIEDGGRSKVTVLQSPAPCEILAKMTPGDEVTLVNRLSRLAIENQDGEYLGQIEPKLSLRIARMTKEGNRYSAGITKISHSNVSVIIWETYRHPKLNGTPSFPVSDTSNYIPQISNFISNYDAVNDEDEEEYTVEWPDTTDSFSISHHDIRTTKSLTNQEEPEED